MSALWYGRLPTEGRVYHFAISEPIRPASQKSAVKILHPPLTDICECESKSEPTQCYVNCNMGILINSVELSTSREATSCAATR
jgi:hypothetical protein